MTVSAVRPQAPWALRLLPPFPAIAHRILASDTERETPVNVTFDNGRALFEFAEVGRYVMFQVVV